VGETVIEGPAPTDPPPQLLGYHFQVAPVPSDPPTTDSVTGFPWQVDELEALIDVAGVDFELTVIFEQDGPALPQLLEEETQISATPVKVGDHVTAPTFVVPETEFPVPLIVHAKVVAEAEELT
jgi:hypothetical protein